MAQMVKNLPAMRETWFDPWVGKIHWKRAWQPIPVFLPGEFQGQRSLGAKVHGVAKSRKTEPLKQQQQNEADSSSV